MRRGTAPFGDIRAPDDSAPYAIAIKMEAQAALNASESDVRMLERWLGILQHNDRFRLLESPHGGTFPTWESFCVAPPPFGLGYSATAITRLIAERKAARDLAADATVTPLAEHGGDRKGRVDQVDDVKLNHGGNSSAYLVRKLKRDRPDIAEALARGEYKSARAAAKAAGLVKDKTPLEHLEHWWTRASAEERAAFDARRSAAN